MLRLLLAVCVAVVFVASPLHRGFAQGRPVVRIGVVLDGPWERNEEILALFQEEIRRVNETDFDIRFPESARIVAATTPESIHAGLERLLADPSVELVIAAGPLGAMEVARRAALPKPVIAPFVLDASTQQIPKTARGTSGVANFTYLEGPETIQQDLETFREIVPFTKLGFLLGRSLLTGLGGGDAGLRARLAPLGTDVQVIAAGGSADAFLGAIESDVDAIYLVPLTELAPGEFGRLLAGLNARRLPTFSFLGMEDVERGVLAGLAAESIFPRYARRIALVVQRILLGDPAADLPVAITRNEALSLNMTTARAIGVRPSFEVLTEAVIVAPTATPPARTIGLLDAFEEALRVNRSVLAKDAEVRAGRGLVGSARAKLLPQVEAGVTGVWIDEDRAAASFGAQAERTVDGSLSLTQLLWSEEAWANLGVQRELQTGREHEEVALRLDIALEAGTAYLQVLRAKTLERIRQEDLRLTRSNLEVARTRRTLGISGPAEVFRWESQLAQGRSASIEANAQRNLAEIGLNRVLHRALEEPFATRAVGLDEPGVPAMARLDPYLADPWSFRTFRTFLTEQALANSPELASFDAAIAAQERIRTSSRRSFYSPTLALRGEFGRELDASGAGSAGGPALPGLELPVADDTDWNVALDLSLPLFQGGERRAELSRASLELERLRFERDALAERIEQRVRSAVHLAGASHAAIGLSQLSAEAARSNLDLVADAYARGAVQIIDLIDAQNAALTADQAAADAVHDFLLDLFEVERALGTFTFLVPPDQAAAWYDELDGYFERADREEP